MPSWSVPRDLSPAQRWALGVAVVALHVLGAWWLSQQRTHVEVEGSVAPIVVDLIAPVQAPAPQPQAQPEPPRPVPPPPTLQPPKPRVVSTKAPTQNTFQAEPEPPRPVVSEAPPAPVVAPPAPVAAAPASAPVVVPADPVPQPPKQVPISAVSYLTPLAPIYPPASTRLGESGVAHVKMTIDERGRAVDLQIVKSSGYSRLDQAALAAVRAARFRPYMEGGVPRAVTATQPVTFDLSE